MHRSRILIAASWMVISAACGGTEPSNAPPYDPPPVAGQIAFSRDGKIYLANSDGTRLVQLTAGPAVFEPR